MDKSKYDILSTAIFRCPKNSSLTHTELLAVIIADFKKNKMKFEGSIEWYMESVKLDPEANKLIHRLKDKSQLIFQIASQQQTE